MLQRRDSELSAAMTERLASADEFTRQTACEVLGRLENPAAAPYLIGMLGDPHILVRRAAALGNLGDASAIPELRRVRQRRENDEINIAWALKDHWTDCGRRRRTEKHRDTCFNEPDSEARPARTGPLSRTAPHYRDRVKRSPEART